MNIPFFKKYPSLEEGQKTIVELEDLYSRTLREISKIIEKKIVIIVPIIKTKQKLVRFDFMSILRKNNLKLCLFNEVKLPLLYRTRNNIVMREIWILEKIQ